MISPGLLIAGGLGEGLMKGVDAFQSARKMKLDESRMANDQARSDQQAKLANSGLLLKAKEGGYDIDPNGGGLIDTDFGKQKRAADLALEKAHATYFGAKANNDKLDADSGKTFKDIHSDKRWQKVSGSIDESDTLRKLTTDAVSNPQSAKALGVYAARYATGGQRLNETEIKALGGRSDAIGDRLSQIMQTSQSGTLTPENAAFMQHFIDVTSQGLEEEKGKIEDNYVGSFARRKKMAPDSAAGLILGTPSYATRSKQAGPKQEAVSVDPLEGKTSRNPQTGERLIRKAGQWVPLQ